MRQQQHLTPTTQLYNSLFESGIRLWNKLPIDCRLNNFSDKSFKKRIIKFWNVSQTVYCLKKSIDRRSEIHLNRILVDFSQLKGDLFKHNLIDSDICSCGNSCENYEHFFFNCINFIRQRIIFMNNLLTDNFISQIQFDQPNSRFLASLIKKNSFKDNNQILLNHLQNYIKACNRF